MAEPAAETHEGGDVGHQRLGTRIERADGRDFPYYDGRPTALTGRQWGLVLLAVVAGFLCLQLGVVVDHAATDVIAAALFAGLPLVALVVVAGSSWQALFHAVTGRDVATMVGFALLNIVVTLVLGLLVAATTGADANPVAGELEDASTAELVTFYPRTAVQLLGEELLTILPFLALLWWFTKRGTNRNRAVVLAWVITAVWFGLLHLPTYDWNVVQCLLVIGGARIVLTLAYIRTKNLWVSTGAHVINDWTLFTTPLVLGALT